MRAQIAELRDKADRLEREAEEIRIRQECHFHGYSWSPAGLCYSVWGDTEQCTQHTKAWHDEYDTWHECPRCHTVNGTVHVRRKLREPEFDAPQPSDDRRTIL